MHKVVHFKDAESHLKTLVNQDFINKSSEFSEQAKQKIEKINNVNHIVSKRQFFAET